jgi:hypothetical protein
MVRIRGEIMIGSAVLLSVVAAASPATRIAVLLDDPGAGAPASAAIERALQDRGYEVVAADTSQKMRGVVAPKELLGNRLPTDGLSVFEADAILAGAAAYGEPVEVEGVKSLNVSITLRLIDLGTGQATATMQADGVGVGVGGPALLNRGIAQALQILFNDRGLTTALNKVGQSAGSVVLVIQDLPNREALTGLREGLEKALAGAPVKEIYFAKGLGKLVLGGSAADSMAGPNIADIISENKTLALVVDEVANTRIVARYDKSRTVNVHALVLEPKLPKRDAKRSTELGKYLATQLATFAYARASYQRGELSRKAALIQAKKIDAGVIIESELLGQQGDSALVIRVIDVATGEPILRVQKIVEQPSDSLATAEKLIADLGHMLPEKIAGKNATVVRTVSSPTAHKEAKK